jgi:hypothetical protein
MRHQRRTNIRHGRLTVTVWIMEWCIPAQWVPREVLCDVIRDPLEIINHAHFSWFAVLDLLLAAVSS